MKGNDCFAAEAVPDRLERHFRGAEVCSAKVVDFLENVELMDEVRAGMDEESAELFRELVAAGY